MQVYFQYLGVGGFYIEFHCNLIIYWNYIVLRIKSFIKIRFTCHFQMRGV